jgi:hypothetical protein
MEHLLLSLGALGWGERNKRYNAAADFLSVETGKGHKNTNISPDPLVRGQD